VPLGLLRALYDEIPALAAEEALTSAQRVAMGSGTLDPHDARALHREWRRAAFGNVRPQKAAPADLAAFGIGYRVVEPSSGR
jgi:hypothetical protein